jgi:tRNA pseudouridine55 synthase
VNKINKKYFIENDVILVHKPVGISSFGLVARMRKILGTRKVGHAGTLDPLASGLMIIGFNKGTKKLKNYLGLDKVYIADVLVGKSTTTGDREGEVVGEKKYLGDIKEIDIEKALESLLGERYYPAPLYSAVKVLGKPLYKYAREKKEPPFIPEKKMHLKKYQILDFYKSGHYFVVRVRVDVGSGTYIRTLAEELGKKIGYPASIKTLYRLSIDKHLDLNSFHINDKKKNKKHVILKVYSVIKKLFRKNKK